MILKHPYCRTCGSKIQSASVCHHCGCQPLKGNNYCCDCSTSTLPQAIMCVQCGASLQKRMAATLAVLIVSILVVGLSIAGYFIFKKDGNIEDSISDTLNITAPAKSTQLLKKPERFNEFKNRIINNISPQNFKKENALKKLAKSISKQNFNKEIKKEAPVKKDADNKSITAMASVAQAKININCVSKNLMKKYRINCTYFTGKQKSNVIFFTTNVFGYLIINGNLFELQGVEKSNDIAKFSSPLYEVTIEIEGLSGNENEWMASGILLVKDKHNRVLARRIINSSCTDF